jgi:hypothetical protein
VELTNFEDAAAADKADDDDEDSDEDSNDEYGFNDGHFGF